jgi:hypothetical protein
MLTAEPNYLYSSRSFWYPQATVSDYATARIRISVPPGVDCVGERRARSRFPGHPPWQGSGAEPEDLSLQATAAAALPRLHHEPLLPHRDDDHRLRVGRHVEPVGRGQPAPGAARARARSRTADIALFYQSIIGDSPYPSFTVAVVESDLPGGHSPRTSRCSINRCPSSGWCGETIRRRSATTRIFSSPTSSRINGGGQAVGWRNYHEQWISEGFAQYFATLYAQHQKGDDVFVSMLRQLRKWGIDASDQGPISLGYRLGHIRGESRVFRALVYNKGAAGACTCCAPRRRREVLQRDPAVLSRFALPQSRHGRFPPRHGSGDRYVARRFFQRWIYGSTIPRVKLTSRTEGTDVVLRIEQIGEVFDLPVTVTIQYSDRKPVDVLIRSPRRWSSAACRSPASCAASRSARTMGCWRRLSRQLTDATRSREIHRGLRGFRGLRSRESTAGAHTVANG